MNLSPGYLWASIVCAVAVAFLILLSIIDRRTPPPNVPFVPYEPDDDEDHDPEREVARLEMFMLTAITRGDKALEAHTRTGDKRHLSDGVLEMRYRLMQGLDMEADELAARLDDEREHSQ